MNPDDVSGQAMDMSVGAFISTNQDMIKTAQLIVACDVDDATASTLSDLCEPHNIALVVIRQYGMVGYLRFYKNLNCIMEPKINQVNFKDLRVASPWPEL